MRKRFFAICLLSCLTLPAVHGEEATLSKVYRSLNTFGNNVRNTFTEDSGDSAARTEPSPTKRHRKPGTKHLSSKQTADKQSESSDESASPKSGASKSGASKKAAKSKTAAASSKGAKKNDSQAAAEEDKPGSKPESAPGPGAVGASESNNATENAVPMATLKPEAIREFPGQPPEVQRLIRNALALTEQNLRYKYGSAEPTEGGMDCSGFIYYVLKNEGYKDVPRDSAEQYAWARKKSDFHAVLSRSGESFELDDLRPGDLLFWSGTYKVDRDIPITHVMIYLGKEKSTGKPVMVGATDGRTYEGIRRYGVSVFDFKMPSGEPNKDDPDLTAKFEGYARIPELREAAAAAKAHANLEQGITSGNETPKAKQKAQPQSEGD